VQEDPSNAELQSAAADPSTPLETLAQLAYQHPALRPAIALNPSTYDGLLQWLGEYGDAEVSAALAQRAAGGAPITATAAAAIPASETVAPATPAPATPATVSRLARPTSRTVKAALITAGAVVVVAALVVGQVALAASILHTGGRVSVAGAVSTTASDYRFGAKSTWKTKVHAVDVAPDGYSLGAASVQVYPGLWLVSWPGDDSGTGRLATQSLIALDPDTGAVKWSTSPGPYSCASSLVGGSLACVDVSKGVIAVLDPSTGKATGSRLNGLSANSVSDYKGDVVIGYEDPSGANVVDNMERITQGGSVVWKKSGQCGQSVHDGMTFSTADRVAAEDLTAKKGAQNVAFLYAPCLTGSLNLDTGVMISEDVAEDASCFQAAPFQDAVGLFSGPAACDSTSSRVLIPRGTSTLTAMTVKQYFDFSHNGTIGTLWSAELAGANLSAVRGPTIAHLGDYALVASSGHLYGIDTQTGPIWDQADSSSRDGAVLLLPIDATKENSPVLALETGSNTIERLDPGVGASRVSVEPAKLPSCPSGLTPVSFTTWDSGAGATLVCRGFTKGVTVVLIVNGTTYTSASGRITPTGYSADFGGGVSVDIGLGGWAAWVHNGSSTTLHAASSGWQLGAKTATAFPALSTKIEVCPTGTSPLGLSTWNGGWLLTCGETATKITKFLYVDGSTHGSGNAMTTQGVQTCGTASAGVQVCVSANPAVVAFTPKGGAATQHSVADNYVAGQGFSGEGKGTGAYGLADPKATAASQVAYLNGILQQSQAARTSVKAVVQNILSCSSTQADVQSAQSVADARTTELQALSAAPVDAVPGGAALVALLQAALQDSLSGDQAYVTAAGQVASGQCDAGRATFRSLTGLLDQGANEKAAFTAVWNSQIAPQYGTPTYTQDDI
jgi:hypothetical protein